MTNAGLRLNTNLGQTGREKLALALNCVPASMSNQVKRPLLFIITPIAGYQNCYRTTSQRLMADIVGTMKSESSGRRDTIVTHEDLEDSSFSSISVNFTLPDRAQIHGKFLSKIHRTDQGLEISEPVP